MGPIKVGQKNKNLWFINKTTAWWICVCVLLCLPTTNGYSQETLSPHSNASGNSRGSDVNSVRLWHSPDKTRIVFDVSDNIDYTVFSLKEPERLVVDIKNSTQKATLPKLEADNKHIAAIRFGAPKQKVLRFVFDLKLPLQEHSFLLTPNELYGHRLVLDLLDMTVAENISPAGQNDDLEFAQGLLSESADAQISTGTGIAKMPSEPDSLIVSAETLNGSNVEEPTQQSNTVRAPIVIKPRTFIVAIDAGHGGEDPGALGHRGSREKVITLSIAKRLKKVIDADPRMQAILIRTGDYYIDLQQRRLSAREKGADIFLSIHADAFTKRSANGLSVFALSQRGATSAMARALAAKENASDLIGGVSLANKDVVLAKVLVDLSMTNTISESVNLGGRVLKELGKVGRLHSKRVEQASFAVLKSPDMPSILIETGFITNLEEERKLRSASYQKKIVKGIYNALSEYHDQTPYYSQSSYASPVIRSGATSNVSGQSKKTTSYHKVKRGDSLSLIASKYGMSLKELKRINGLRRNTAVLGKRLKVTGSAVSSPQRTTQKASQHTVKRGESLSLISAKYNVTISALKSLNNLSTNTVRVGQVIKLPTTNTVTSKKVNRKHTVKRGDTLSEIAEQYGVTIKTLMKANSMRTRTVLLGQRLSIPN